MIEKKKKKVPLKSMNAIAVMSGLLSFGLLASSSMTFVSPSPNSYAFAQTQDKISSVSQSVSNPSQLTSPEGTAPSSQLDPPTGFVAKGTINSLINVPNGKWIAVGNWSMTLNNGEITFFGTNMTWHDSNGTTAHTHGLAGFRPSIREQVVSLQQPSSNNIVLEGITDVGTNNRISWTDVPTTININGRKIVAFSVDDNKTNHHFAGQSVFGIVSSFVPCSDLPGPNMEVLPPCTTDTSQASFGPSTSTSTGLTFASPPNETSTQNLLGSEDAPGIEGSLGSEDAPNLKGPAGSEDAPGISEDAPGISEDAPGIEQSEDAPNIKSSLTPSGQTNQQVISEPSLAKTTSPGGEQVTNTSSPGSQQACDKIQIINVTTNGFESDPVDYHPANDAIDGNSSTWWSNQGENSWLKIDLGRDTSLCEILVEWNKGDERKYTFEIAASETGNDFKQIFDGTNQEGSSAVESYKIDDANGRYLTLTVTGSSSDKGWVSIKEIGVIGSPIA